MEFCIALLKHPVLMVILLMFFMGFMGMTYEFILRLWGRKPFLDTPPIKPTNDDDDDGEDDETETPEAPAPIPAIPTSPNDVLAGAVKIGDSDNDIEGAEEIEDEDGNITIDHIYKSDSPETEKTPYMINTTTSW